jgi:hypothetical protein
VEGGQPISGGGIRKTRALLSNICHAADRRDYGIQEQTGGASGTSQHADGLEFGSAATVTGELNHVFALRLALQPPSRASLVPSLLHAIAGQCTTRGGGAKAPAIAAASTKELRRMETTSGSIGPMLSGSAVCLQTVMLGYFAATAGSATSRAAGRDRHHPWRLFRGHEWRHPRRHETRAATPDTRTASPRVRVVLGGVRVLPTPHAHGLRSADHPLGTGRLERSASAGGALHQVPVGAIRQLTALSLESWRLTPVLNGRSRTQQYLATAGSLFFVFI